MKSLGRATTTTTTKEEDSIAKEQDLQLLQKVYIYINYIKTLQEIWDFWTYSLHCGSVNADRQQCIMQMLLGLCEWDSSGDFAEYTMAIHRCVESSAKCCGCQTIEWLKWNQTLPPPSHCIKKPPSSFWRLCHLSRWVTKTPKKWTKISETVSEGMMPGNGQLPLRLGDCCQWLERKPKLQHFFSCVAESCSCRDATFRLLSLINCCCIAATVIDVFV